MARNSAMYIRATSLSGSAPLPFVISTGAQRSGETLCVDALSWKGLATERPRTSCPAADDDPYMRHLSLGPRSCYK